MRIPTKGSNVGAFAIRKGSWDGGQSGLYMDVISDYRFTKYQPTQIQASSPIWFAAKLYPPNPTPLYASSGSYSKTAAQRCIGGCASKSAAPLTGSTVYSYF